MSEPEAVAYSVVIPCYRSAGWLQDLVGRVEQAMASIGSSFEILLVNDASPDATWQVIEDLARSRRSIRGFDLLCNTGQFRATLCGLEHARGRIVVTLDDDLQNLPEDIPKLVAALEADPNLDCVMAAYAQGKHGTWLRDAGTRIAARIRRALHGSSADLKVSAFRAMRRPLVRALCESRTRRPILASLILELSDRVGNVDVEFAKRHQGESGYTIASLLSMLRDEVIAGSTLPLRAVATTGILVAAGSLLLGLSYLVRYWSRGISVPGFTTLTILIIFFGGMTLLSIGVLGEYVARILHEVSGPARYRIRRETGTSVVANADRPAQDEVLGKEHPAKDAAEEKTRVGPQ